MYTCTHAPTHAGTRTHTHTYKHTYTCSYLHSPTCMRTQIRTHARARAHTHTHTHTHTQHTHSFTFWMYIQSTYFNLSCQHTCIILCTRHVYKHASVCVLMCCHLIPSACWPVCVSSKDRQLAQAVLEKRLNLENVRRREMDVEEEVSAGGRPSRSRPPARQAAPSGPATNSQSLADANAANIVRTLFQRNTKLTSSSGDLSGVCATGQRGLQCTLFSDVVCCCALGLPQCLA